MSQETQAWAKQQRTGDPVTRAVLSEICNWAKPTGVVDFRSYDDIAYAVEVSRRTVMRHVDRMENELKLIRRVSRHRDDGGQGANGFELIGFEPALSNLKGGRKAPVPACHPPGDKSSPAGVTSDTAPGDTVVTRLGNKIIPPSPSDEGDSPPSQIGLLELEEGEPSKPHVLPDGWEAPKVDDLTPEARALVRQWPAGAYAAQCANFKGHWTAIDRRKRTAKAWRATLSNWLIRVHAETMRAAKAGVSFEACAPRPDGPERKPEPPKPVLAKRRENSVSEAIHGRIRREIGDVSWAAWIKPCAIIVDAPGIVVVAPSRFCADWIERSHSATLKRAAATSMSEPPRWVRFDVEDHHSKGREEHGEVVG